MKSHKYIILFATILIFGTILLKINDEIRIINSPDFNINVINSITLPILDDSEITFENFDNKMKKAKLVETCVLYIDIRESTQLSLEHKMTTLSKLYSSFVRGVIKCAMHYGGKVRNIIGDRVMVLFDPQNCFKNAVNTAILLNTFSIYIFNKYFRNNFVQCGIGIDYGKMLATKTGTIKRGIDSSEYKSLVWLGRPANIASKLADIANKSFSKTKIRVGQYYPYINDWHWSEHEFEEFFDSLELTYSPPIIARFKEPYQNVLSFFKTLVYESYPAILMTKKVYEGFKRSCPYEESIKKRWWKARKAEVAGYKEIIYGSNIYFTFGEKLV